MSLSSKAIWIPVAAVLAGCRAGTPHPSELLSAPERMPSVPARAIISLEDLENVLPKPTILYGSLSGARTDVYARPIPAAKSPCVVDPLRVFERIPEFLRIRSEALNAREPEYWILLAKANEKFYAAVREAVRDLEVYDTVFHFGHVRLRTASKADGVPDITYEVIQRLGP